MTILEKYGYKIFHTHAQGSIQPTKEKDDDTGKKLNICEQTRLNLTSKLKRQKTRQRQNYLGKQ